jgi:hypothetical protein
METTRQSPKQPTKQRRYPSFSQMWIGGTGLLALPFDMFRFGSDRYENIPSNETFIFAMLFTLIIGYWAWKSSQSRYRDVAIVIYAIAAFSEALYEASDASNKVGFPDFVFDGIWIAVACALYKANRRVSE